MPELWNSDEEEKRRRIRCLLMGNPGPGLGPDERRTLGAERGFS